MDYIECENKLISLLSSNGYEYDKIENVNTLIKVYELFADNKIPEISDMDSEDTDLLTYLGYYYYLNDDWEKCEYVSLKAIERKDPHAIYNFGSYLEEIDQDESIKYFKIASDFGIIDAHIRLYELYKDLDETQYMKYILRAVEMKNEKSINILTTYLFERGKIDDAKKYANMGIELGNVIAMVNMAEIMADYDDDKQWEKYLKMASDNKDEKSILLLGKYYIFSKRYSESIPYLIQIMDTNDDARKLICDMFDNGFASEILKYKHFKSRKLNILINSYFRCFHETKRDMINKCNCVGCKEYKYVGIYYCKCRTQTLCCQCIRILDQCPACGHIF